MRVKIKTWKQLEVEFGLNEAGDINTTVPFTSVIESCVPIDRIIEIKKIGKNIYNWCNVYSISDDIIEYYINISISDVCINSIISNDRIDGIEKTENKSCYVSISDDIIYSTSQYNTFNPMTFLSPVQMETTKMERYQKSLLFQNKFEKLNLQFFDHLLEERVEILMEYKKIIHKYDIKFNSILNELTEYHKKYIKQQNPSNTSDILINAKNMYILNSYDSSKNDYDWLEEPVRGITKSWIKKGITTQHKVLHDSLKLKIVLEYGKLILIEQKTKMKYTLNIDIKNFLR